MSSQPSTVQQDDDGHSTQAESLQDQFENDPQAFLKRMAAM